MIFLPSVPEGGSERTPWGNGQSRLLQCPPGSAGHWAEGCSPSCSGLSTTWTELPAEENVSMEVKSLQNEMMLFVQFLNYIIPWRDWTKLMWRELVLLIGGFFALRLLGAEQFSCGCVCALFLAGSRSHTGPPAPLPPPGRSHWDEGFWTDCHSSVCLWEQRHSGSVLAGCSHRFNTCCWSDHPSIVISCSNTEHDQV